MDSIDLLGVASESAEPAGDAPDSICLMVEAEETVSDGLNELVEKAKQQWPQF